MDNVLAITLGYLIGSVPFAQLLSARRGIDLRRVGSGNVGASNLLRTLGVRPAVVAMCLDAVKGAVAVLVAQRLAVSAVTPMAAGVASVVGHVYPVWLRFRGGKGVATAAGVFAVVSPIALAIACAVFVLSVWITRYISVGSLAGTLSLAVVTAVNDDPIAVPFGAAAAALVIVYRHRANLSRILAGTERRIGQRLSGLSKRRADEMID
ncbi:MAG TPA: glycerol-3-phosphate 1-O-acyltransferase PlsY [Vicinamibacterales bacterium]|nr:glycerol-3-phosphate 1-O-acyltransferase PlsY [Vicinamibacterales bacterium]